MCIRDASGEKGKKKKGHLILTVLKYRPKDHSKRSLLKDRVPNQKKIKVIRSVTFSYFLSLSCALKKIHNKNKIFQYSNA